MATFHKTFPAFFNLANELIITLNDIIINF